ncbi:hypothetical protein [Thiocystis violascens]|uniref:Uncharacterized protein n=1 Tax=Thiocystis violascens (strain ATCC 17096 / DSM 198 / 6111) TaxID=765911 RepID=I3YER9_THIV6|nr:hypothetical protein [Thiocystis violascens]AFL75487.1 hypothetical protein Thivi_3633 [Thiocystis violascens DSM 198]
MNVVRVPEFVLISRVIAALERQGAVLRKREPSRRWHDRPGDFVILRRRTAGSVGQPGGASHEVYPGTLADLARELGVMGDSERCEWE